MSSEPETAADDTGKAKARAADCLTMNDIARVVVVTQDALPIDDYRVLPESGAFILIDETSHQTVAAGMIRVGAGCAARSV